MREIKYRIWDKKRNKFAKQITTFKLDREGNINLIVYLDKANKTREITEREKIFTNEFEPMQFTGLLDKNGVETYEGDIIRAKNFVKDAKTDRDCIDIIHFKDCNFLYGNCYLTQLKDYDYEVIGNIYENKELLND